MKTNSLFGILLFLFYTTGFISCDDVDDGSRGFMQEATIMGDDTNGYYCFLDGGGLVVSYDQGLGKIERGYFAFNYMEDNWTSVGNERYIDNAHIIPYSIYNVIHPVSLEEAKNLHILDKDSCSVPSLFTLNYGYRGYFDFNTGISVVNLTNGEKVSTKLNLVYDPAKQTPDTLRLNFCYNPNIPDKWSKPSFDYGTASCDISSLATLQSWSDSVTIAIETGDDEIHLTKIGKNDFFKPEIEKE